MSNAVGSAGAQSQLRLAHDDGCADGERLRPSRWRPRPGCSKVISLGSPAPNPEPASVLVAGSDPDGRSAMLGELRNLLPASTHFVEAGETWELLARAAGSRMVVLTDDIGEISSASVVRLLGRRHPGLPVLAVELGAPAGSRRDLGAASV
jgi:hypothetical protein